MKTRTYEVNRNEPHEILEVAYFTELIVFMDLFDRYHLYDTRRRVFLNKFADSFIEYAYVDTRSNSANAAFLSDKKKRGFYGLLFIDRLKKARLFSFEEKKWLMDPRGIVSVLGNHPTANALLARYGYGSKTL